MTSFTSRWQTCNIGWLKDIERLHRKSQQQQQQQEEQEQEQEQEQQQQQQQQEQQEQHRFVMIIPNLLIIIYISSEVQPSCGLYQLTIDRMSDCLETTSSFGSSRC